MRLGRQDGGWRGQGRPQSERALAVGDQAERRVRVVARNDQDTAEIEFIAATGTGEGILENRMVLLPDGCRSRSGG